MDLNTETNSQTEENRLRDEIAIAAMSSIIRGLPVAERTVEQMRAYTDDAYKWAAAMMASRLAATLTPS